MNAQQRQKDHQNEGVVNLRITDDDKPQKKKKKKEKREKQQDAEFAAFDYSQADKNIFLGKCYSVLIYQDFILYKLYWYWGSVFMNMFFEIEHSKYLIM